MPQLMLPLLSSEITYINGRVTVYQKDGLWVYFLGDYPIYSHKADDLALFRLTTAQLIDSGACKQIDIIKTFGVSKSSLIRAQKKYREGGSNAFFSQRQNFRKKGTVLTIVDPKNWTMCWGPLYSPWENPAWPGHCQKKSSPFTRTESPSPTPNRE